MFDISLPKEFRFLIASTHSYIVYIRTFKSVYAECLTYSYIDSSDIAYFPVVYTTNGSTQIRLCDDGFWNRQNTNKLHSLSSVSPHPRRQSIHIYLYLQLWECVASYTLIIIDYFVFQGSRTFLEASEIVWTCDHLVAFCRETATISLWTIISGGRFSLHNIHVDLVNSIRKPNRRMPFNKHITVNSPHVKYDEVQKHLNVDYEYSHTTAERLPGGVINVSLFLFWAYFVLGGCAHRNTWYFKHICY